MIISNLLGIIFFIFSIAVGIVCICITLSYYLSEDFQKKQSVIGNGTFFLVADNGSLVGTGIRIKEEKEENLYFLLPNNKESANSYVTYIPPKTKVKAVKL